MTFILAIIPTVIIYRTYHEMFQVTYFGLIAFFREIVGIFVFSLCISYGLLG